MPLSFVSHLSLPMLATLHREASSAPLLQTDLYTVSQITATTSCTEGADYENTIVLFDKDLCHMMQTCLYVL